MGGVTDGEGATRIGGHGKRMMGRGIVYVCVCHAKENKRVFFVYPHIGTTNVVPSFLYVLNTSVSQPFVPPSASPSFVLPSFLLSYLDSVFAFRVFLELLQRCRHSLPELLEALGVVLLNVLSVVHVHLLFIVISVPVWAVFPVIHPALLSGALGRGRGSAPGRVRPLAVVLPCSVKVSLGRRVVVKGELQERNRGITI